MTHSLNIQMVGINYQTAPIEVRELAAFSADNLSETLSRLRSYVPRGVILSTCNRTEVYFVSSEQSDSRASCLDFLRQEFRSNGDALFPFVDSKSDREVVEHVFRVAAGLDSMVVGEHEVLGQVRQALEVSETANMTNLALRNLFQSAVRAGRRVRDETSISRYGLSISSVAVSEAIAVLPRLDDPKLLIIGAGDAGRQAVKVAISKGLERVCVIGRTGERASRVTAEFGGHAASPERMLEELADSDIVITCAASPHPVLRASQIADAMSRRPERPMVIVDIAVPRNVDPGVGKAANNVRLYNIDDLNKAIKNNRTQRQAEASAASAIVRDEVDIFMKWWREYSMRPIIKDLTAKFERTRQAELNKTRRRLNGISPEDLQAIDTLTKSIVSKVLQEPIGYLKDSPAGEISDRTQALIEVFGLEETRDE